MTTTRAIERLEVTRGTRAATTDRIADEAPLEIRARGAAVATILRTPGHDRELARGLAIAEGIPGAATAAITQLGADVVELDLPAAAFGARSLVASAACGLCGRATIADLERRAVEVAAEWTIEAAVLAALPDRLRAAQDAFGETGGLHGAALADRGGALLATREDVGRHNALDKVIGWAADRLPGGELIAVLSGRLGYELAQKAVAAGIPIIVAISAPSTLAIDVCERFGVTACGFVRAGRMNVYSHGWRITQ